MAANRSSLWLLHQKQPEVFEATLPPPPLKRRVSYRRPWIWRVGIVVVIIVLVAVIVPIAVVMSRKHNSYGTPSSTVLVPLYVYPEQGAWDPLYNA